MNSTTENDAIDEAFSFADFISETVISLESDDGVFMAFEIPSPLPVHDVEVLIDDNGTALETTVPSCTIDGVRTLVELLWEPTALLAVRFGCKVMNSDNRRIIALNAPARWQFPVHYLM